jgi:hypothetical protein
MRTVEVLEIDSPVLIGPKEDKIQGVVVQVVLDAEGIGYKVAWWNGRERRCEWLRESEVDAYRSSSVKRMEVGFANGQSG